MLESVDGGHSRKFELACGIPQGACLGPLLFIIYASDLFHVMDKYQLNPHAFADDIQLHLSFKAGNTVSESNALITMEKFTCVMEQWMSKNE